MKRWTASHLFGAWIAYWVVLIAATLWRPLWAMNQIRRAPEGTSRAQLSFGDGGFVANVQSYGRTLVDYHVSAGAVVFWLTVPPILIFLLWLALRPRADRARARALGE